MKRCGIVAPQNDPDKNIDRKMKVNPELFLVGELDEKIISSDMGGYEGIRGWVNYLAVDPDYRRRGYGKIIINEIERKLSSMGCPKIYLQARETNVSVIKFYEALGLGNGPVKSFGKRLEFD